MATYFSKAQQREPEAPKLAMARDLPPPNSRTRLCDSWVVLAVPLHLVVHKTPPLLMTALNPEDEILKKRASPLLMRITGFGRRGQSILSKVR